MENKRIPISQSDIDTTMDKLSRNGKYSAEILKLAEEDMKMGITRNEIELYLTRGNDIRIARIISDCLRKNYGSDVLNTVCATGFNFAQMQTAYAIYIDCNDLKLTKEIISEMKAVPEKMKVAYKKYKQNIAKTNEQDSVNCKTQGDASTKDINDNSGDLERINKAMDNFLSTVDKISEKLAADMDVIEKRLSDIESMSDVKKDTVTEKDTNDSDDKLRQQLLDELAQKEQEIISKQDELTKAISQVKSLNRSNEKKDDELKLLKETVADLQKQVRKKGDALEDANATINKLREADRTKQSEVQVTGEDNVSTKKEAEIKEVQKVDNVIPVYYTMPVAGITIDKTEKRSNGLIGLLSKLCFRKKSRVDIIKLVSAGKLSVEQLSMIKVAIEKQLTEGQLVELINNNLEPSKMREIIEIAVLENSLPD